MSSVETRDVVLNKIKKTLDSKIKVAIRPVFPDVESIYKNTSDSLELTFAEEFSKLNGKFIFCEDFKELTTNIRTLFRQQKLTNVFCQDKSIQQILTSIEIPFTSGDLDFVEMKAAITGCEFLIARTGSIMVSSAQNTSSRVYAYAPIHIVFAKISQLVYDFTEATKLLQEKYVSGSLPSMISIISGSSMVLNEDNPIGEKVYRNKLYLFLINS